MYNILLIDMFSIGSYIKSNTSEYFIINFKITRAGTINQSEMYNFSKQLSLSISPIIIWSPNFW